MPPSATGIGLGEPELPNVRVGGDVQSDIDPGDPGPTSGVPSGNAGTQDGGVQGGEAEVIDQFCKPTRTASPPTRHRRMDRCWYLV